MATHTARVAVELDGVPTDVDVTYRQLDGSSRWTFDVELAGGPRLELVPVTFRTKARAMRYAERKLFAGLESYVVDGDRYYSFCDL